jgi:2-oxoglutarate ferredoxin oxidoreductase subunit beta
MPAPMGVFLDIDRYCYEDELTAQITEEIDKKGKGDLEKLLFSGNVWEIK